MIALGPSLGPLPLPLPSAPSPLKLVNRAAVIKAYLELLSDNLASCNDAELIDLIEDYMGEPWELIEPRWFNN